MQDLKDWHSQHSEAVLKQFEADPERGLSSQQVDRQQAQFGLNAITKHDGDGPIKRFALQFHQPLVYILLFAVVVTLALQEWVDAIVIFAVVLLNAIIGFVQESKAINAINALSGSIKSTATVIRDGVKSTIAAQQLVPGDIVLLQAGDKVTADMRLVKVRDLQIDESALTGESVPVEKNLEVLANEALLGDRQNMAFSSTLVVYGTGVGVVTETGDNTEIGKISELIATTPTLDTPLTKRIKQFSHVLLYAIVGLAAITLLIGYLHGQPLLDSFMAAVALAVGAIPEGLPAAVTIMLAIGVSRMAKRKAVIRNLPAVETLGSTTIICSDKTGTLTKNEMTVEQIYSGGQLYTVSGNGYDPAGEIQTHMPQSELQSALVEANTQPGLYATLRAGALCNDAQLLAPDTGNAQWRISGDPTEAALLVSARKANMASGSLNAKRVDCIPFQSEYQYMATLDDVDDTRMIHMKGSIESILPKCQFMLNEQGACVALDQEAIEQQVERLAAKGLRVLAFASKATSQEQTTLSHEDVAGELVFLGLQAMIDPPRPEAIEAVAACHRAGIRVKMITGDHALTATSIAKQLGIIQPQSTGKTVTGYQLGDLSEHEFSDIARNNDVFARVSPENKLQLVKSLQAEGHVVAMTGDGVNDAPALRRADIGVAMALNGTEVARDASDMMLTDDNFATVRAAVEEGRGVFDNLKKFIVWTLPTNGGEGLVILLAVLLGVSLPLLPVHILWVNMTTAILLGLMLAFEPREKGIMERPPYDPDAPIIDRILMWRILLVSSLLCITAFGLYELELMWGATEAQARTVAVAMFVVGEAFYLFNCRSLDRSVFSVGLFSNRWIWIGIALMMALQLLFTYLPLMNDWFQSAPISVEAWLRVIACGWLISLIVGVEKHLRSHSKQTHRNSGSNTNRVSESV
ncbi:cation-transporting P-type ATPase [Pseudoalteromonas sp. OOF1S-7]|uniref:cation-transporting P-type ATPase n=1 Tax=Pseudoalteromonas sp. OOF1S-7 TaxID=2917757 RepID=UPI001EF4F821|nr:cation-transporting P-type ATPase [Pseudoalteromonas sp. OOF1S-7]MCG7535098.1 cation-transporting P-type ATPase [Pseudoalteromonas sp. OOF1S-7]